MGMNPYLLKRQMNAISKKHQELEALVEKLGVEKVSESLESLENRLEVIEDVHAKQAETVETEVTP